MLGDDYEYSYEELLAFKNNKVLLKELKNNDKDIEIKRIELDFYYYNLKTKCNDKWCFSKIFTYDIYLTKKENSII